MATAPQKKTTPDPAPAPEKPLLDEVKPKAEKKAKVKLTPEQRQASLQAAREQKLKDFFTGKSFTYVGPIDVGEGNRYTDPTGNKGRSGHQIKDDSTGEVHIVGPGSLQRGVEDFQVVKGYVSPAEKRAAARAEAEAAKAASAAAEPAA